MKLTKEQKFRFYRSIALQLEKSRIDKGWSLEQAEIQTGEAVHFLLKLEYGLEALHKIHLGNLSKIAANYDKMLRVEFIDPPKAEIAHWSKAFTMTRNRGAMKFSYHSTISLIIVYRYAIYENSYLISHIKKL